MTDETTQAEPIPAGPEAEATQAEPEPAEPEPAEPEPAPAEPEPAATAAQARPDLTAQVARYLEIKPLTSEAERIRKFLIAETEGYPRTVAGEFVIEGGVRTRRMKEQPAKPAYVSEYWGIDIRRAGERSEDEA